MKWVLPHYQIYFKEPVTVAQVQAIMRDIITEAIEERHLKPNQYCKVELVRDDSAQSIWQAVRLTPKGCTSFLFRRLAKLRVASEDKSGNLCTQ